jgi:hypothetical protein
VIYGCIRDVDVLPRPIWGAGPGQPPHEDRQARYRRPQRGSDLCRRDVPPG